MESNTVNNAVKEFYKFATGAIIFKVNSGDYRSVLEDDNGDRAVLIARATTETPSEASVMWGTVESIDGEYIDKEILCLLFSITKEVCTNEIEHKIKGVKYNNGDYGRFCRFVVEFTESKPDVEKV